MLSYTQMLSECQSQSNGDTSSDSESIFKRGINQGLHQFRAALRREYTIRRKTFSIVANQVYYQMPEDAIRLKYVEVTVGSITYPLQEIQSNREWQLLGQRTTSSNIPEFFYVRGNDQFGIWPDPASNISNGGTIEYQARSHDLGAADVTSGTVTVTNGDATVTHSGTNFVAGMVGRSFRVDDGSSDQIWYKIDTFTDTSNIELENVYGGTTGAGKSYIIGEVPDIPGEYHQSLIDYALYRYYMRRRDVQQAAMHKNEFDIMVQKAKSEYSNRSTSRYIPGRKRAVQVNNIFTDEPDEVS